VVRFFCESEIKLLRFLIKLIGVFITIHSEIFFKKIIFATKTRRHEGKMLRIFFAHLLSQYYSDCIVFAIMPAGNLSFAAYSFDSKTILKF
jgi:hypothetical protein